MILILNFARSITLLSCHVGPLCLCLSTFIILPVRGGNRTLLCLKQQNPIERGTWQSRTIGLRMQFRECMMQLPRCPFLPAAATSRVSSSLPPSGGFILDSPASRCSCVCLSACLTVWPRSRFVYLSVDGFGLGWSVLKVAKIYKFPVLILPLSMCVCVCLTFSGSVCVCWASGHTGRKRTVFFFACTIGEI